MHGVQIRVLLDVCNLETAGKYCTLPRSENIGPGATRRRPVSMTGDVSHSHKLFYLLLIYLRIYLFLVFVSLHFSVLFFFLLMFDYKIVQLNDFF